jgi:AAHS family 4-hydroxybenzoate transporter-like MFS transporter
VKPTAPKIEIGQVIDERKLSFLQIIVIVMGFLVVWLDGYHLQSMGLVVPILAKQWSLKPSDFQLVISSALIGLALASAFIASMGDRLGRRSVLVISMAVIGISSIGTGYATGMMQLVIWRFFTGLGLGASVPNAIALTTDYVPARRRAVLVTVMFSGMTIGAFASGYIAPPIIAALGWRGIFTIVGAVPLLMSFLLAVTVPESVRLLIARVPDDPRIPKILARLAPEIDAQSVYVKKQEIKHQSVIELFSRSYMKGTLLLWFVFLVNMFILYFLVSWLPTLLSAQGWASFQAMRGTVMVQAGGVLGGLILSWRMDKGKTLPAMISSYTITAIAFGLFARLPSTGLSWWILLIVVGGGISGGQFVLNALAASYYPPLIRATGVGWAYSIGRIGAVLSGFAGGLILERVAPFAVLEMLVIPVVMCIAGVLRFRNVFQPAPAPAAVVASRQSSTR